MIDKSHNSITLFNEISKDSLIFNTLLLLLLELNIPIYFSSINLNKVSILL